MTKTWLDDDQLLSNVDLEAFSNLVFFEGELDSHELAQEELDYLEMILHEPIVEEEPKVGGFDEREKGGMVKTKPKDKV